MALTKARLLKHDFPVHGLCAFLFLKATRLKFSQEDVNGEKLTVKKWWIFGADFFTVWCRFFTVYADFSRFVRDINGEKKTSPY